MNTHYRHKGFAAVLGLLIVIAIILILYGIQSSAIFGPPSKTPFRQNNPFFEKPWLQEDRLVTANKLINMPGKPKPDLNQPVCLKTIVSREEKARGKMDLKLGINGTVTGNWQCKYQHPDNWYSYSADFSGNIDITYHYVGNKGRDKSKLFFFCKGHYLSKTTGKESGRVTDEQGIIYVQGFLNPDYTAFGIVTLTTDQSWSVEYDWKSTE